MKTLVISDTHLGARDGRDVLRRPVALELLLDSLKNVDRLVLLGDLVELLDGRVSGALLDAKPILKEIGRAMSGREIIVLAGNHDHALVRGWLRERRELDKPLSATESVPHEATKLLQKVVGYLSAERTSVRVHYPGVWLSKDVFAHHGHYLERQLSTSTIARVTNAAGYGALSAAEEYEAARSPSFAAASLLMRDLPDDLEERLDRIGGVLRAVGRSLLTGPGDLGNLTRTTGPVVRDIVEKRLQRGGLDAMQQVAEDLGVDSRAKHVLFGHVHRLGPTDQSAGWQVFPDSPMYWNSGCWVLDPWLCNDDDQTSPFWPGGALEINDGQAPKAVNLLREVEPADLRKL